MDMRIPIFQLDYKNTYKDEYNTIIKVLNSKCISYEDKYYNYFDFVNTYLFHLWKYRGTYLDCYSYLEFLGVHLNSKKISEESFLNFLEFLLNIQLVMEGNKKFKNVIFDVKCQSILFHNIPLLLESMGYAAYDIDDKICLLKRDLEYDDLMELVPDTFYDLLLSYHMTNYNGIKMKRILLQKMYGLLLKDIDHFKSLNPSLFSSIKLIITKMGVIGEVDKKYRHLSHYKLRKYYDYCCSMITYLLQTDTILKYKEEVKGE